MRSRDLCPLHLSRPQFRRCLDSGAIGYLFRTGTPFAKDWTMWMFSNIWHSRQKKAVGRRRRGGGAGSEVDSPFQDSRDSSLSADGIPSRYTDIEGGYQHYRDNSVDGSVNGNTSGNTPFLATTDRRASLKPIVTSYWVESSPIGLTSPTPSRWERFRSYLPFTRTETGPILTPEPPTSSDRTCSGYISRFRKSCVFRWMVFVVFLFFITLSVPPWLPILYHSEHKLIIIQGDSAISLPCLWGLCGLLSR